MFNLPSPIQKIDLGVLNDRGVELWVKRDDLIHSEVSGNKWRKLKFAFEKAKKEQLSPIISFGGAFSNHLAALASAGMLFDIPTIGIIRGEERSRGNPTLIAAKNNGMELRFVSRSEYRDKGVLIDQLQQEFIEALIVPEGGADVLGVMGCTEILKEVEGHFDLICAACGTGTTLAGLALSASPGQKVLGFTAMKQGVQLVDRVDELMDRTIEVGFDLVHTHPYDLATTYHFGGFAKVNDELIGFMRDFSKRNGFYLDPVYTGKMFFGLFDMIDRGFFRSKTKILAIHSGGIQGLEGMLHRGINIYPQAK